MQYPPMRHLAAALVLSSLLAASARSEQVVFSEIHYSPKAAKPEFVEIFNMSMTPLDMAKWKFTDGFTYEFPDFNAGSAQAHFLKPLERIVVSAADEATTRAAYGIAANVRVFGPWTGLLDNAGERVTVADKNGVVVASVAYGDGGRWPKAADGAGHSIVLRNENNPPDNSRNWRASTLPHGTPGVVEPSSLDPFVGNPEIAGASATLIEMNASWKYLVPVSDPGTAWRALGFDDSAWAQGPALIGYEPDPVPPPGMQTVLPTPANPKPITYLFRKEFTFSGNPAGATFIIDQIVDDGAYYYLNGQPLGGLGYAPGGAWDAGASRTVGNAVEEPGAVAGVPNGLVNGLNVLTAEAHQANNTSSDLVFGARFKISSASSVVINEVKPGAAGAGFVEFFNTTGAPIDLQGHYLSDTPGNLTKHQIAGSLVVPAGGFATIGYAESQLAVQSPMVIYLTQPNGATVLNALSASMALDGRSLGRLPAGTATWFLFLTPTPGAANADLSQGFTLRINEAHFAAGGNVDWVELQNTGGVASASGLFLASLPDFSDKIALSGSVPGNGYASWTVNFPTDGSGDVVLYLIDSANTVLGIAELERVLGRDSLQAVQPPAWPVIPRHEQLKSQAEWYSSTTHTRDAANAPPIFTDIVIHEIMCDPPSGHDAGEYIELHNRGGAAVSLAGWRLRGGIDFDFSATSIAPGGYLVVAKDAAFIAANYAGATVVGNWSGALGNKGDLIRLIDNFGNLADEVDYEIGGDWPNLAAGLGSSLELVNPALDNSRASAWRDSDESAKGPWQAFTTPLQNYQQINSQGGVTDYRELHLHLVGDAHIELRTIAIKLNGAGANILTNTNLLSTNGSSASGWLCQGTHWASFVDGAGELNLIADGHGDNRANRAEIDATALAPGNYTVSFEARWVSGRPRLIAQTWDHTLGGSFLIPVPNNLGTAGAANSRFAAAAPPQVDSVLHSPAVPRATEVVKVTARVVSSAPLASVQVWHRADDINNANAYVASPMFDDGTNGDAVSGDGMWTASLTQHQVNNRIVQFYVRATAQGGALWEAPRGGAARPGMWIVDNRVTDSALRRQRIVLSAYDRDAMVTASGQAPKFQYDFPRLSNHYFNAAFIHNESDVYYLSEVRKAGSPWTRPDDAPMDRQKVKVADDRSFRQDNKWNVDNDAEGANRHHNRMTRYWLYLLGHPGNEAEYIYSIFNADNVHVREANESVNDELTARAFPNGNSGQLMAVDDEWWFTDTWAQTPRNADWAYKNLDAPIRYHSEYGLRSRETEYDFSALTEFFKTVSNGGSTEAQLRRVLDPEMVLMLAAVRGYIYDWDSQTLDRGKNCYLYRRPSDGRWMYFQWDSDLAFGDATAAANNTVVGGLPGWATFIGKPWTRKIFNYYLTEMLKVTTGANAARSTAWLDAEDAASTAYTCDKVYYQTWMTNRRTRIESEINLAAGGGTGGAFTTAFAVTTPVNNSNTAAATQNYTGTAPSSAFTVTIDGHPEAVLVWVNQTTWNLNGVALKTGANVLTFRMNDAFGGSPGTVAHTVNKTGNAAPFMRMIASPASMNVVLGQTLTLDASTSIDPDGGALTFAWANTPIPGASVSHPTPATTAATFTLPNIYSFTATGTDIALAATPITREIAVYNTEDFASFGEATLAAYWTLSNLETRDNHSPSGWYSLEDKSGALLLQVFDDTAKPLAFTGATHPRMMRPLPSATDWTLQTDLSLDTRQTGVFFTGLYLETVESGSVTRYAFGLEAGNALTVKRSTGGAFANVATVGYGESSAVIRIRRIGNSLVFLNRNTSGVWVTIHTRALVAGSTAASGGIFTATTTAQSVRTAFDYVMLVDPANANTVFSNLRITEVMYHPAAPGTVEFIELRNTGAGSINLLGARFDATTPFDLAPFGNIDLAPGQYAIVTNDTAAFQAKYGTGALILGQWSGALNNGGERIILRDSDGNEIHDFTYLDIVPWPTTPDGMGPSLEVIDVNGNYGSGLNWRASFEIGGSPGWTGAGPDTDGDGQPDSWEALFGTDPNSVASRYYATATRNGGGQPVVNWPSVPGQNYRIDYTNELLPANWQPLATVTGTGSYTDISAPLPARRFYKVTPIP